VISLRTICDIVVAGLTTVISGIAIWTIGNPFWLTTFTGLILLGGIVVLLTRAPAARLVAMAAHTSAIVLIAAVMAHAAFYHNVPNDTLQLVLLLMLFPASMLSFLTVDHYFVTAQSQPLTTARVPLKRRLWRAGFLIASALMLMTSVVSGFWLAGPLWTQSQSRSWERTEATLVECKIVPSDDSEQFIDRIDVLYEYEVDGVRKVGSRLSAIPPVFASYSRTRAERIAADLAPGTRVQVVYNLANPDESLLFPGITGEILLLLLAISFYCCSFPVWFYYLACRDHAWLAGVPAQSKRHDYWSLCGSPAQESVAIGVMSFAITAHLTVGITGALTVNNPSLTTAIAAWAVSLVISGLIFRHVHGKTVLDYPAASSNTRRKTLRT